MFKFLPLIASFTLAFSTKIDLNEFNSNLKQQQIDMINFQNERIREHQELTHQQRQMQFEQLNDQRRVQEQLIRDHEQNKLDRIRENQQYNHRQVFIPQISTFIPLHSTVLNIPSSTRHLNVEDDSNYDFKYAVSDMMTGDMKTHKEIRRGDEIQGQYTLMDSDGYHRTVNYRANDRDGFDADVRRDPAVPVLGFIHQQNFPIKSNGFSNNHAHFNNRNGNNQERWSYSHQINFAPRPISATSTSVSKIDDGQLNHFETKTMTT